VKDFLGLFGSMFLFLVLIAAMASPFAVAALLDNAWYLLAFFFTGPFFFAAMIVVADS
jgi:hypothetical protein